MLKITQRPTQETRSYVRSEARHIIGMMGCGPRRGVAGSLVERDGMVCLVVGGKLAREYGTTRVGLAALKTWATTGVVMGREDVAS